MRRDGVLLSMMCDDGSEIDVRQHVAVEDDSRGIDVLFGVLECASGSKRRSFNGISNPDPVIGTVFQQVFDLSRLIGQAQNDLADTGTAHQIDLIQQER